MKRENRAPDFGDGRALVTGATGVLGTAFCFALAERGENLYITGRSGSRLEALKTQLTAQYPSIKVDFCACDLADDASVNRLFSEAEKYKIHSLYNVAGADIQQPFCEYGSRQITFQIRSTFEGAARITDFAIKHRAEKLKVLNVSSVCGILPMPYFALYSASKGALTSFSVALAKEMKGTGVKVQVVLPGAIYTRDDVKEYIKTQGVWGRLAAKQPEWVVKKCLALQNKRKVKTVLGFCNKVTCFFNKLLPESRRTGFVARRWKKTRKNAFFTEENNEQS